MVPMPAVPPGPSITLWKTLRAQLLPRRKNRQAQVGFLQSFVNVAQKYGDIVFWRYGGYAVYMLNHPDYVHQLLVTDARKIHKAPFYKRLLSKFLGNGMLISDGDYWRRQRRLAQPAFHAKRIAAYAEVMTQYTQRMLEVWQQNTERDIASEMMQLTLNVVAKTLLDADVAREAKGVGTALTEILEYLNARGKSVLPSPDWLPTVQNRRWRAAAKELDRVLKPIIEQRAQSGEDHGDLLSMLLMTTDDENSGQMSLTEIRDEAMTIFLAGHETTANALTWTFYLLSQHREIEDRLHNEVDTVLQGRIPTLDDLKSLPYTLMVIKEAMRLYPPVWSFARQTIEALQVGGYVIPKGSQVFVYPYIMHRDPRFWKNPEQFDPQRFSPENEQQQHRYAYFPFGGGPRICIGNNFALMEAQLVLATVAARYRLRLAPDQQVEPEAVITLRPRYGMRMLVEQRQPAVQPAVRAGTIQSTPN